MGSNLHSSRESLLVLRFNLLYSIRFDNVVLSRTEERYTGFKEEAEN